MAREQACQITAISAGATTICGKWARFVSRISPRKSAAIPHRARNWSVAAKHWTVLCISRVCASHRASWLPARQHWSYRFAEGCDFWL